MKKILSGSFVLIFTFSVLACGELPVQAQTFVPVTSISVLGAGSVMIGATLQLSVNVFPSNAANQTVSWSVSPSNSGAISSSGLFTAYIAGTVTVTATANDGSGISGSAQVTVNPLFTPVTSISVTATSSIMIGATAQMSASISPSNATNQTVSWSVSPSGAATVNQSGMLMGYNPGTVTVTATANDGSGISGSVQVTINPLFTPAISISVSSAGSVSAGGTIQMSATVAPSNATNQTVSWSVSPSDFAVISQSGLLTARGAGTVTVIATANDGSGVSGSEQVTVNLSSYTPPVYGSTIFTLTYAAGAGGSIIGPAFQTVNQAATGTTVTAVPNAGYQFVSWSDGSTANPRTDADIQSNINIAATFSPSSTSTAPVASPAPASTGTSAIQAEIAQLQAQVVVLLQELLALLQAQSTH